MIDKKCDLKEKDFGKRLSPNRKFVNILPQPIENVEYSDAKKVQYLIRGSGIFHLGQSSYFYQDERRKVLHYSEKKKYDKDYLDQMNQKINALRYLKFKESNDNNNSHKNINVTDLMKAYCNDDWYKITYNDGVIEEYIHSGDERVGNEIQRIKKEKVKIMSKTV